MGEADFTPDVKEWFYRTLAVEYVNEQIIIMENDTPPVDLSLTINTIEFSGSNLGRQGFIPVAN